MRPVCKAATPLARLTLARAVASTHGRPPTWSTGASAPDCRLEQAREGLGGVLEVAEQDRPQGQRQQRPEQQTGRWVRVPGVRRPAEDGEEQAAAVEAG